MMMFAVASEGDCDRMSVNPESCSNPIVSER